MNSRVHLESLRAGLPVVMPSMLQCNFGNLEAEVRKLEEAGAKAFHLDVMDGVFVPNFTYGMTLVHAFRQITDLPLDVHLMMVKPGKYIREFCEAGADIVTFHIEATDDPEPLLHELKELNVGIGLAANPNTPVSRLEPYLPLCDLALIMSVEAGFGGQSFNPIALEKLKQLRDSFDDKLLLQVDGGVNKETIAECSQAGAELFVVGSAIFNHDEYQPIMHSLTELAKV